MCGSKCTHTHTHTHTDGNMKYFARINVLAQGHNAVTQVRLEPAATRSRVKHSTTEPLRSQYEVYRAKMYGLNCKYNSLLFSCPFCAPLTLESVRVDVRISISADTFNYNIIPNTPTLRLPIANKYSLKCVSVGPI